MKIVVCSELSAAEQSAAELARRLPQAQIVVRSNTDDAAPAGDGDADYAMVWMPPQQLFAEQRRLKAVFALGAGVDALLAMSCIPHSLPIIRLEDAGIAGPMADYVLTAVLRVYRRFDAYAAQQRRQRWQQHVMVPKRDYRIGVLGLGAIGGVVARHLAAYGFAVRGCARSRHSIGGVQTFASDDIATFLDRLDVLVNVLPLTAANRGILNREHLSRLADGAHLINIGRGAHLVETDLLTLLDNGKLNAATLDVFAEEPLPADHPFWRREEITITPHAAAVTEDEPVFAQVAAKMEALERGERISGCVDRIRGY